MMKRIAKNLSYNLTFLKKKLRKRCFRLFNKKCWLDKVTDSEERIKYYLGNVNTKLFVKLHGLKIGRKVHIVNSAFLRATYDNSNIRPIYFKEMKKYYYNFNRKFPQYNNRKFLFLLGDIDYSSDTVPYLTKTRPISKKGKSVLLPLKWFRHWKYVPRVKKYDIPYEYKKNVMLWRGVSTGEDKRVSLVRRYYNFPGFELDIGFTEFVNEYRGKKSPKFLKDELEL